MRITPPRMRRLHQLLNQHGLMGRKHAFVWEYSQQRTESSSELLEHEAVALIRYLENYATAPVHTGASEYEKANKMRRKMISMAYEMGWTYTPAGAPMTMEAQKADVRRISDWCIKSGYLHKPLNDYSYSELPKLVTQFEEVYKSYFK